MFDYDRMANLLFCLTLIGLFVLVFNMETVLTGIRQFTSYLIPSGHGKQHPSHHRRARSVARRPIAGKVTGTHPK